MKILFIDACISPHEKSRTRSLCYDYFEKENINLTNIDILELYKMNIDSFDKIRLLKRDNYIINNDYSDTMFDLAKQLKEADEVIIGAPYWDLSFPAILKIYIEHIMVNGLTFYYQDNQIIGLCKAQKMTYITTSGGFIENKNFGYDYIRDVFKMLGVNNSFFICKEGLDIK